MKKIKLLVAAVFLSLFFWAVNVSAEDVVAIDEDAVTIDNVTYILSDSGGYWLACSGLGHESTERLVIRDEIRGIPIGTIVAQGFSFTDAQEIVLPNTDVIIYMQAFADSGIRTLTIPASVKLVDEGLALRCKNLETVYWNTKLGIPDYAFTHCTALRSVTLPENLTSIGAAAFSGCRSLKEIYIPSSVSYIDAMAFNNIPELTIKGEKYSYAYYYAKAQKIPFQCIGEAENPVTNRPIIASVKQNVRQNGNSVTCSLLRNVPGVSYYEYYVLYDYVSQSDWPYTGVRFVSTEATSVTFHNIPKGGWKIVCRAKFKKSHKWSNEVLFQIDQQPAEKPEITKVQVNGRNVTVTVKAKNPVKYMGYDCVLAKRWNIIPEEKAYTIKNKRISTITFKNVKPGTYYVGAHSFVRENVTSGLKVFGEWSEPKKIVVK